MGKALGSGLAASMTGRLAMAALVAVIPATAQTAPTVEPLAEVEEGTRAAVWLSPGSPASWYGGNAYCSLNGHSTCLKIRR